MHQDWGLAYAGAVSGLTDPAVVVVLTWQNQLYDEDVVLKCFDFTRHETYCHVIAVRPSDGSMRF